MALAPSGPLCALPALTLLASCAAVSPWRGEGVPGAGPGARCASAPCCPSSSSSSSFSWSKASSKDASTGETTASSDTPPTSIWRQEQKRRTDAAQHHNGCGRDDARAPPATLRYPTRVRASTQQASAPRAHLELHQAQVRLPVQLARRLEALEVRRVDVQGAAHLPRHLQRSVPGQGGEGALPGGGGGGGRLGARRSTLRSPCAAHGPRPLTQKHMRCRPAPSSAPQHAVVTLAACWSSPQPPRQGQ